LKTFEEIVDEFSARIRYLANRTYIQSQSIGKEDIYQEMLYHLWERWRRSELEDKTDSYIVRSCYFHIKNYLRRFSDKKNIISLNTTIGEGPETLENLIPDTQPLINQRVDDVLFIQGMKDKELSRRENEVAELLGQGHTLREIGAKLGISHVAVLKIKNKMGKKFRKSGYKR